MVPGKECLHRRSTKRSDTMGRARKGHIRCYCQRRYSPSCWRRPCGSITWGLLDWRMAAVNFHFWRWRRQGMEGKFFTSGYYPIFWPRTRRHNGKLTYATNSVGITRLVGAPFVAQGTRAPAAIEPEAPASLIGAGGWTKRRERERGYPSQVGDSFGGRSLHRRWPRPPPRPVPLAF